MAASSVLELVFRVFGAAVVMIVSVMVQGSWDGYKNNQI